MVIKVLVVDDSFFMRKIISDILNSDPQIEVIDTAKNGLEALEKVKQLKPDVITLDIRMPDISGLDVLDEIMKKWPTPTVIVSAYGQEGSKEAIQSYEYGAVEVVAKPSGEISIDIKKIKEDLLKAVKAGALAEIRNLVAKKVKKILEAPLETNKKLLTIGASTGGPLALAQVLSGLPRDLPIPVIIIQHMSGEFTKPFAERLNKKSRIEIKEAERGDILKKGNGYLVPGDYNLEIKKDGKFMFIKKKPKVLRSIDFAMKSAAKVYKDKVISVVLTGMGDDGKEGAKELKKTGSKIIVQDEKTSVVFGMPKEIIKDNNADFVLPLEEISEKIIELLYKKN